MDNFALTNLTSLERSIKVVKHYLIDVDYTQFASNIKDIKGKFILSHYKDDFILDNFKKEDGYFIYDIKHYCSVNIRLSKYKTQ